MTSFKFFGPLAISVGLLGASAAALADDADKAPPAQHAQMMKHCMKKMKSDGGGNGASDAQMKAQCEADIKSGKVNDGVVNSEVKKPSP